MSILNKELDVDLCFGELCERLDVNISLDTKFGGFASIREVGLLRDCEQFISNKLKQQIFNLHTYKPSGHDIKRCIHKVIKCKANDYNVTRDKCIYNINAPLCLFYTIQLSKKLVDNFGFAHVPKIIIRGETYRVMEIRVSAKLITKSPCSDYLF